MKLSWLARLVGLPRSASEQEITEALERTVTRANSREVPGEGSGVYDQVGAATGQRIGDAPRIYGTQRIEGGSDTDPYIVKAVRQGHWAIFSRQSDSSYLRYSPESIALDALQAQCKKLNDLARGKASAKANETITVMVNEEMRRTGSDYTTAFCNVKARKPELFWTMKESAAEHDRERQRLAKARR